MKLRFLVARSEETIAALLGFGFVLLYLVLQYSRGRFGWMTNMLRNEFVYIASILLAACLLLLPIALGFIIVFRSLLTVRQGSLRRFLWSLALGVLVLALSIATVKVARSRSAFALGYANRIESEVNVADFQEWATQAIETAPTDRPSTFSGKPPDTGSLVFSNISVMPNADSSQSYVRLVAEGWTLEWYGLMVGGPSLRCSQDDYQIVPGVCVSAHMGVPD